jgi:7-dehydrocholesterol reductase
MREDRKIQNKNTKKSSNPKPKQIVILLNVRLLYLISFYPYDPAPSSSLSLCLRPNMIVTDLQSINPALTQSKLVWGRRDSASWQRGIITAFFMLACPVIVVLPWIALEQFDNSIVATISALLLQGPVQFLWTYYPHLRFDVLFAYLGWVVFQGVLYSILTGNGIHRGQTTPSGHILEYKVNGFAAWTLSVTIAIGCAWMGVVDPSIIATHWGALLATLNVYGIIITGIFYIKAHLYPTHKRDRRFSGSFFYDLYMGIELNPRLFGRYWDVKLFHNGRPGIIGWALMSV